MIRKFQFPWTNGYRVSLFSSSFYLKRWNGSRVTTRLENRCYMPIFRVSIETRNILSLLQISKSSQILSKASLTVIVPEKRVPLYFFFFFYDTLSLEFPYITRVVYIIVSTQCCYYRVEIRFNTLQGRRIRIFFDAVTRCLFRFPCRIIIFYPRDR